MDQRRTRAHCGLQPWKLWSHIPPFILPHSHLWHRLWSPPWSISFLSPSPSCQMGIYGGQSARCTIVPYTIATALMTAITCEDSHILPSGGASCQHISCRTREPVHPQTSRWHDPFLTSAHSCKERRFIMFKDNALLPNTWDDRVVRFFSAASKIRPDTWQCSKAFWLGQGYSTLLVC